MDERHLIREITMDTNLDYYRTVIDNQLIEIKKNLGLFPEGRHKAYFALLSVHQLATDMSEIKDLSREIRLLLGHESSEKISQML
jgi:hypothetical protein